MSKLNLQQIRADFPILQQKIFDKPLIYFDNSSTTQKPHCVLESLQHYYTHLNANVHRGVHTLSQRASEAYENVRLQIQQFIHAKHSHEIIFTRGTTESINLVAESFGRSQIGAGDEVIISAMEHHSNLVPWQILCEKMGAQLRIIPLLDNGDIDFEAYIQLLNSRTKLVAITHVSNVLGTVNPVKKIIELAHQNNTVVLLDGAQAIAHMRVDVQELDCDFYVFSSHKMYGPTGVGVLYGKTDLLNAMPPYQTGGGMISQVTWEKTVYNKLPEKFEAGTPDIANVIAFSAALTYLQNLDLTNIYQHEHELLNYTMRHLRSIPGLRVIGNTENKAAVISLVLDNIHAHDIGTLLDHEGIAVRAGHHCAMPLMQRFNVPATVRVSFGVYNTLEEVDVLVESIHKAKRFFA